MKRIIILFLCAILSGCASFIENVFPPITTAAPAAESREAETDENTVEEFNRFEEIMNPELEPDTAAESDEFDELNELHDDEALNESNESGEPNKFNETDELIDSDELTGLNESDLNDDTFSSNQEEISPPQEPKEPGVSNSSVEPQYAPQEQDQDTEIIESSDSNFQVEAAVETIVSPPSREHTALLSNYEPRQGELIAFSMPNPRAGAEYELNDSHFPEPVIPFLIDGALFALIPIVPEASTGKHNLYVEEFFEGDHSVLFVIEYEVQKIVFTRQDLAATTEMTSLLTDENVRHDRERRAAAVSETAPLPLWDGVFVQPVEGRITTQFGQERYTNGRFTSRHSAFDIAAPTGTDIKAPASGRVTLAEELFVSGNAVIIDHGMWLFTYFYHLHEIFVSAGDFVNAGDIIGAVGTTGYSTGPHLHYGAAYKNQFVNPDFLKSINPLEAFK